jgi:hypothetical protein
MNSITPIDRTRDTIVGNAINAYNTQTDVMTVNKQVQDVVAFFSKMFGTGNDTAKLTNDQSSKLQNDIRTAQQSLDQLSANQPLIQNLLILLVIVWILYMFGSFLGSLIHWAAMLILLGGFYYIINFSQTSNNG